MRRGTIPKPCRMTKLMKKLEADGRDVPMACQMMLRSALLKTLKRRKIEPPSIPPRNTLKTSQEKYSVAMRRSTALKDVHRPSIRAKLHRT
jgi:hypothetical protein